MGYSSYSSLLRSERSSTGGTYTTSAGVKSFAAFDSASINQTFDSHFINAKMSPFNLGVRTSRDSEAHPNSLAIIIALDVTGSMGRVPHYLVKNGLPTIVQSLINAGIKDPQILFIAIGDHECDTSPLQIGQFESGDAEMDYWLTSVFLEGGGGGNNGESYMLAWYAAAHHTAIDCFEKRGQKGFLFTIGDEPVLQGLPKHVLKKIIGEGQFADVTSVQLKEEAEKMYNVFHINIGETSSGGRQSVKDGWKQMFADNLLLADRKEEVADIIIKAILTNVSIPNKLDKSTYEPIEEVAL